MSIYLILCITETWLYHHIKEKEVLLQKTLTFIDVIERQTFIFLHMAPYSIFEQIFHISDTTVIYSLKYISANRYLYVLSTTDRTVVIIATLEAT